MGIVEFAGQAIIVIVGCGFVGFLTGLVAVSIVVIVEAIFDR